MKNSDVVSVFGVALVTATLMLVMFWPSNIDAVNDGQERAAEIAVPKLIAHRVEFTLISHDNQACTANQEPELDLRAFNTSSKSVQVPIQIVMVSRSVPSPISRMAPVWRPIWQDRCSLRLNPGETKTIAFKTGVKLSANSQFNVLLQASSGAEHTAVPSIEMGSRADSIVALSFSTAVTPLGPGALAIR